MSSKRIITSAKETNEYGTDYDSGAYSTLIASVHNKDVQVSITMYEDLASDSVSDSSGNNNISNETQVRNTLLVSEPIEPPKGIPREYIWLLYRTAINTEVWIKHRQTDWPGYIKTYPLIHRSMYMIGIGWSKKSVIDEFVPITDVFTTPANRRTTRYQSRNRLHNEQIFFDWLQYAADNNLTSLFS